MIETLVISGGGFKGFAALGALQALRARGIDFGAGAPRLRAACGVSVGAILAFLIALGYSVPELVHHALTVDLGRVIHLDLAHPEAWALDSGLGLREWLEARMEEKGRHPTCTLNDLAILQVGVIDILDGSLVILSAASHPSVPAVDAVLASAALPPVFPPVRIVSGAAPPMLAADGGLANFFPIQAFAGDAPPESVLGIRLRKQLMPDVLDTIAAAKLPLAAYLKHIVDIVSIGFDAPATPALEARVINVWSPDTHLMDAGAAAAMRANMQDVGRKAAEDFLKSQTV